MVDSVIERLTHSGTVGLAVAIAVESTTSERPGYRRTLFPMVCGFALLAFFAAPWPVAVKAHAFLHGLCAQRPSHTYRFGGQPLPFDARMTGIYLGFFASAIVLVTSGADRRARLPRPWIIGVGAALIVAMGIDGFNSFFLDLGLRHLYRPSNQLRLATGAGVGIVLACAICYLVATSLWRRPDFARRGVDGRTAAILLIAQAPIAIVLAGWSALFLPLTLLLLISATAVMSLLALVTLVMLLRADNAFDRLADVQVHASVALALGVLAIALLAGLRFLFERHFGPSPLV